MGTTTSGSVGPEDGAASSGVVALLFTDVVGSTRLLDRLGDDATETLRRNHFALLREAIQATGGEEVKSLGDGLMVAFASPVEALRCSVEMQRAIAAHNHDRPDRAVEIRVGLHVGDPPREEGDFFGTAVVVARRLCDRAAGGQILASELLTGVAGNRGGYRFRRLGRLHLKGLAEPVPAVAVEWEEPAPDRAVPVTRSSGLPVRGPRLVGRDEELVLLETELARAADGEFRCLLLLGDPGVGKTRLAAELLAHPGGEVLVLSARAYPFGQTASFGLWSEAFERHLRHLSVHDVVELCGGFLDDLAGLLRSVAAARGAAPEGEAPLLRLMDGLAVLLANLAVAAPVLIVLDDVHLADASSWEALHYLAHTLSDARVLVVACARPAELAEHPSAGRVVSDLEQDGQLRRLVLPPVGRAALAELSEGVLHVRPPESLVKWLAARSRGNPLFALGLLQALVDEGGDLSSPRLRHLPETLTERVANRLVDLGDDAVAAVEILAVLARPIALGDLARLGGCSLDEMAGVIHQLIRARLVLAEPGEPETTYELAHPLLQEVVYERIGPSRQRTLHRLAARTLLASGQLGEAAPHFARCAVEGDPEAVDALRDALRQAEEREAHFEALDILATLIELVPVDDDRWLELIEALSPRAHWTMDYRMEVHAERGLGAMRFLDSVLERSSDLARRAAVKYRLAGFLGWGTTDLGEAVRLAERARDLFEEAGDRRSMSVAAGGVAYLHSLASNWAAMEAEVERAVQAAEAIGEPHLARHALHASARTALWQGRFDEAQSACDRLVVLAREENDADHLAWGLTVKVLLLAFDGHISEIGPLLAEAQWSTPVWRLILMAWEAGIHWLTGDIPRALACAERFVAQYPEGLSPRRAVGAMFAALAASEADRQAESEAYLARAQAVYQERGWSFYGYFLDHAAAVLAARRGRRDEGRAGLREASAKLLEGEVVPFAALALVDQAELEADEGGDPEVVRQAAGHLQAIAARTDRDFYGGFAAFGRALAELAGGDARSAARPADEAVAVFSSLGYRLLEGRALVVLGRTRAQFDRSAALDAFQRAATTFETCGAVWRREQAKTLMRGLGGRGRKVAVAGAGPGALTRREREVAQLAAKGQTARQIADALFVGERTVEGHLASVYAKLGISSKVDLARRAAELGL
jgi:class 3 adenylate cyclase/DNA-binding CsgD family transcriptional regulator